VTPGAGPSAVSGLVSGSGNAFGGFGRRFGGGGGPPAGFGFGRGGGTRTPPTGATGGGGARTFGGGGGGGGFGGVSGTTQALTYVDSHGASSRFPADRGGPVQHLEHGHVGSKIAAMGGFTGRETVMSAGAIARLVAAGDARYFLLGDGTAFNGGTSGATGAPAAIAAACRTVSSSVWNGGGTSTGGFGGGGTLYDCSGKAAALRAAG